MKVDLVDIMAAAENLDRISAKIRKSCGMVSAVTDIDAAVRILREFATRAKGQHAPRSDAGRRQPVAAPATPAATAARSRHLLGDQRAELQNDVVQRGDAGGERPLDD